MKKPKKPASLRGPGNKLIDVSKPEEVAWYFGGIAYEFNKALRKAGWKPKK